MTRARLIVNPSAGLDRAIALLATINDRLRTLVDELDVTITTTIGDAERAAARAVTDGCAAIYVAGGDGTLNGALRGILSARELPAAIPIGVLPAGTGNDFARALGMGDTLEQALDLLLDPRVIEVDVGTVNGLPFINASAGGFVAEVSEAVTEGLKDLAGKAAYVIGGARALFASEPFAVRVRFEGGPPAGVRLQDPTPMRMFAVSNARFIGGGFPIAPMALIDDGLFDVLFVPEMSKLDFVAVLQRIGAGDHQEHPGLLHCRTPGFDLEFDRPVRVNTDGELLEAGTCRYRMLRKAARFFCGPSPYSQVPPAPFVA